MSKLRLVVNNSQKFRERQQKLITGIIGCLILSLVLNFLLLTKIMTG